MTEARAQPRYLLDPNVCIYLLEGLSATARARAEQCALGEIATSAIAYAEVLRGVDPTNAHAMASTRAFFDVCAVLPFEGAAAEAYRHVPFRLARFDRLIGAHALALGLTVVTDNEADYNDIPGLTIENWTR